MKLPMGLNCVLIAIATLSGCALSEPAGETRSATMKMTADIVPLAQSEQRYARGAAMSVPEEPPPFPVVQGRYIGMQSDLEAARRAMKSDDEPRPIPREPIP